MSRKEGKDRNRKLGSDDLQEDTSRRTAPVRFYRARHPNKASAASASRPSASSSRVPFALTLGATSPALKALMHSFHSNSATSAIAAKTSVSPHSVSSSARLEDLAGAGAWHRWSEGLKFDIDDGRVEDVSDGYEYYTHASPTLHLPHLLRAGALLTHAIKARSRSPPNTHIRSSGVLSLPGGRGYVFRDRMTPTTQDEGNAEKGKDKVGINALGIVSPHDIEMLDHESRTGRGWIARTTDAIFLEKPQHYESVARPGLQLAIKGPYARRTTYRLFTLRFTRSDVKLVRIPRHCLSLSVGEVDQAQLSWGVYRDVCVVCARLFSSFWRTSNECEQRSWAGSPRKRSGRRRAHVHAHRGDGIEGHRASYRSHDDDVGKYGPESSDDEDEDSAVLVRSRQMGSTLAPLQAQTRFLLSCITTVPPSAASSLPDAHLTTCDLLALALGPL
ncbi:hypothetical protein EDB87DRAFT_1727533 [Lactarius vividus]|nr:hypothetical protein EDB87DRAFT_1727533 [Lactarius vividus]